jgi:hypothetical protein
MTRYSLSPGYIVLQYAAHAGHVHKATFPVQWGETPEPTVEPVLLKVGGGTALMSAGVDTLLTALSVMLHIGDAFQVASAWYKPTPTSDPTWIYDYVSEIAGGSASVDISCLQSVWTFGTELGNLYRLFMMEGIGVVNVRTNPPLTGDLGQVAAAILDDDSIVFARDNSRPVRIISHVTKLNDHLRKKFLI